MAHEVGHVLLPPFGHSRSGIMRATMDGRIMRVPGFMPDQADTIRKRLARERAEAQRDRSDHQPNVHNVRPQHAKTRRGAATTQLGSMRSTNALAVQSPHTMSSHVDAPGLFTRVRSTQRFRIALLREG
jgi:hypothetical protein